MSSILEALKKAEQESLAESGATPPWSAPLPERSPYPPRKRRWWLPLGVGAGVSIGAAVFWLLRPAMEPSPETARVSPPSPSARTDGVAPATSVQERERVPDPVPPAPAPPPPPPKADASGSAAHLPAKAPVVSAPPARPAVPPAGTTIRTPPPPATPAQAPAVVPEQTPTAPPERTVPEPVAELPPTDPAPDGSTSAAAVERQGPVASGAAGVAAPPPAEDSPKRYRSDPRIELQALVWAPDPSARFVVINNRLIKEGGSTDGITVVRINRDDVLLAEGADRWHEKFKIR